MISSELETGSTFPEGQPLIYVDQPVLGESHQPGRLALSGSHQLGRPALQQDYLQFEDCSRQPGQSHVSDHNYCLLQNTDTSDSPIEMGGTSHSTIENTDTAPSVVENADTPQVPNESRNIHNLQSQTQENVLLNLEVDPESVKNKLQRILSRMTAALWF